MFKKYSPYLPAGLDVQAVARFFTELFTFLTSAAQELRRYSGIPLHRRQI
jgi:hypothetical protein